MTLECGIRAESNINDCDALLSRNLLSDSFLCVFRLRVSYLRVFLLFISRLYRVLVVDVCTVAWCYVVMSRNLSGFVHKLSHVDQFLCPHFKKQRRRFLPEELRTVKLNIFLHCEFICQCSLICIFLFMFSTVGVWMFLSKWWTKLRVTSVTCL